VTSSQVYLAFPATARRGLPQREFSGGAPAATASAKPWHTAATQAAARGKTASALLAWAACWVAVACCGCAHFTPGTWRIMGQERTLDLDHGTEGNRWVEEGWPRGAPAMTADSPDGLVWARQADELTGAEAPGPDRDGCRGVRPAAGCGTAMAWYEGLGCRVGEVCGGLVLSLRERMGLSGYVRPRFHPVPVRPVFFPCMGMAMAGDLAPVPAAYDPGEPPPASDSPWIEPALPPPAIEEVPAPEAEPGEQARVAAINMAEETASRPGSRSLRPSSGVRPE
jgi:hypothetical protein